MEPDKTTLIKQTSLYVLVVALINYWNKSLINVWRGDV